MPPGDVCGVGFVAVAPYSCVNELLAVVTGLLDTVGRSGRVRSRGEAGGLDGVPGGARSLRVRGGGAVVVAGRLMKTAES